MTESFFKAMTDVLRTLNFWNRTAAQMRAQQLAQMERELVMSATELDHARARHAMNQRIVKRLRAEVVADGGAVTVRVSPVGLMGGRIV